MSIAIARIGAADYLQAQPYLTILNKSREVDIPRFPPTTETAFRSGLTAPWPGRVEEKYVATLDGTPAGILELTLPQMDNVDNVSVDLRTVPELRRRGVGTALLEFALNRGRELGRRRVIAHSRAPLPGSDERFDPATTVLAERYGLQPALREVQRVLDLSTVDHPRLDSMLADAWTRADGYRLVQWSGPTPDELVDDVAYLDGRLNSDAPLGDLAVEAERVDVERIRQTEAVGDARGRRLHHTGLIHIGTGRLVSWTAIGADRGLDWHAWQLITIVDPDHRGHRLGTIAKIENLRYLIRAEPAVREIGTFNAAANSYMIAINEAMGFRALYAFENWQRDI